MTNHGLTRRAVLGTILVGTASALAGCSRSSVEGAVVENETPLTLSHEYGIQATPSGTRVVVDVTVTNDGSEPLTLDDRVPRFTCTFFSDSGEQLLQSGRKLVDQLDSEESTTVQFALAVNVDDATRYELRSTWAEA